MSKKPLDFGQWWDAHARCETCCFYDRGGALSGRCTNQEIIELGLQPFVEPAFVCGAGWHPNEAMEPVMEAAIEASWTDEERAAFAEFDRQVEAARR